LAHHPLSPPQGLYRGAGHRGVVFVLIEFALIIIPFAFLELRPEATKARLKNVQEWLLGHARQLMAYTAVILGAYLTVSGLIRLS
jgi:hypothetical protein